MLKGFTFSQCVMIVIRRQIHLSGITEIKFRKEIGIGNATFSRIQSGASDIKLKYLQDIADGLSYDLPALIRDAMVYREILLEHGLSELGVSGGQTNKNAFGLSQLTAITTLPNAVEENPQLPENVSGKS